MDSHLILINNGGAIYVDFISLLISLIVEVINPYFIHFDFINNGGYHTPISFTLISLIMKVLSMYAFASLSISLVVKVPTHLFHIRHSMGRIFINNILVLLGILCSP